MVTAVKKPPRLFTKAKKSLVGGVNSPVRSFKSVKSAIIFAKKAKGPYLWDTNGKKYIDYIMSWGVSILGHAFKPAIDAAGRSMSKGSSFGLSTEGEVRLAEMVKSDFKSIDKLRFVTSGTEACMSAVRLARAFSGKTKIIKFDGCYHGHFDSLLVKSGSGNLSFGIPSGQGILKAYAKDTISIAFNDAETLREAINKNKNDLACVIVEPVPCNMGVILPGGEFLKRLRALTAREGIVLIFDEVITGFRLGRSGAQKVFGIEPDITCLGKIIGGGLPMGALGGKKEILSLLSPEGPVYQAGTLSGNPVAVAAGIKVLEELKRNHGLYLELERKTEHLCSSIARTAEEYGVGIRINKIGSIFSIFFTDTAVQSYSDTLKADKRKYAALFRLLFQQGVLLPPSPFEACFVSAAHGRREIEKTLKAFRKAFRQLKERG